ncbi:hypothetical protein SCALM49S_06660 [Streptomyces californicus]
MAAGQVVGDVPNGRVDDLAHRVLGVVRLVGGTTTLGKVPSRARVSSSMPSRDLSRKNSPASASYTSSPTPRKRPARSSVTRAAVSMRPPRLEFTRIASSSIALRAASSMMCWVAGAAGHVQADQVGLGEQPLLLDVLHPQLDAGRVVGHVPAEQLHAVAVGDPGERLPRSCRCRPPRRSGRACPSRAARRAGSRSPRVRLAARMMRRLTAMARVQANSATEYGEYRGRPGRRAGRAARRPPGRCC